jgi:succinate-semialdehyde dehydrogenase/glutarate-semialdehyde dehydrogenase
VTTFELGGHAPVLVCADADLEAAAGMLCGMKYRNAGQSCINPTRYLVQRPVYEQFVKLFTAKAAAVKVGNGLEAGVQMGPMANPRRIVAVEALVADAVKVGAKLLLGGKRIGTQGNFFEATVLGDVPVSARAMNEEPFGPLALFRPFDTLDEAIAEANRLPYGLGAYAFTKSPATARAIVAQVESGMVSINHLGLGMHETPFGGVKDSGYGFEGGSEAIEAYIQTRFATVADL